ncbi:MAG: glutamate mutase L [Micromonosporaceae bacterium]
MVACADVGSTFTKVAVVDLDAGEVVAAAEHPTTVDTDVLHGLDAALAAAGRARPDADLSTPYVCSSAGGGLRLAVVGYEQLVTAEAGHRVGLTAGAKVVHVAAGPLDRAGLTELRAARPDVVLLVGGTDGGDADVLRHNATRLANARLRIPVVLAGNAELRDEATGRLRARGVPVVATQNVLPRIGVLNPGPARDAIREVFLRHVIGGKGLSRGPRFARLVRAATPDAVLSGVELLADELDDDLLVVDVGGATTDVYSALGHADVTDVAGSLRVARTVEGDLGVRWNAAAILAAAVAERLLDPDDEARLGPAATARSATPGLLPVTDDDSVVDARLAGLAAAVAVRRHARGELRAAESRLRRNLGEVRLVVGSGGVLRHSPRAASAVTQAVLTDHAGGWARPRHAVSAVDTDYVLAPAGLLAREHPSAARALLRTHLLGRAVGASGRP